MLAVVTMLGSRWEKQLRQEVRIQVYFQRDLDNAILKTALASVESDVAVEEANISTQNQKQRNSKKLLVKILSIFLDMCPFLPQWM